MARIFEIVPVTTTVTPFPRHAGSVERDLGVTYAIGEDAEEALDLIVRPYGQIGGFYLDTLQVGRGWSGPWAFVALQREYDIATYIRAQRDKIDTRGPRYSFGFAMYDLNQTPPPKVACFGFASKNMVAAVAEKIRFLRPAWTLLQDKAVHQKWLVLLDEDPMDVMNEAASYAK
jgi:hypothetical protein